jgi:hypothetical protein
MNARHDSIRAALIVASAAIGIATTSQSAKAAWSYRSALPWSSSSAQCSAGGMGDSANRFAFGNTNTLPKANCVTTTASANAMNGWGGGSGTDFIMPGTAGSFGPYTEFGPVSDTVTVPSFTPGTTGITFSSAATVTQAGKADVEIGAFLFTGDATTAFGNLGPTNIEGLISLGIISSADVLFDLSNASIPASFTFLPYNFAISSSQVDSVVFDAYAQSVPEPSTWALMIVGFAVFGLAGSRARRIVASVA